MKTEARVIADSVTANSERLTTLQVCFPRFILAEFNTHRVVSRNFRSSRAVPVEKLIEEVRHTPFIPSQFTRNQAGMQGGEALSGGDLQKAELAWRYAASDAATHAEALAKAGVHKQYANRGLEPYLYVHGVISATEWDNFFTLRCHKDAQPEFQELAEKIRDAIARHEPTLRPFDPYVPATHPDRLKVSWHLPYVTNEERESEPIETLRIKSAARCAWVSYTPFDQSKDTAYQKCLRTYEKLMSTPMHASPFEHVATPGNTHPNNFVGWSQWRHFLEEDRRG